MKNVTNSFSLFMTENPETGKAYDDAQGGLAPEQPAYSAGNLLTDYVNRGR